MGGLGGLFNRSFVTLLALMDFDIFSFSLKEGPTFVTVYLCTGSSYELDLWHFDSLKAYTKNPRRKFC
jgi:hypothetical protein